MGKRGRVTVKETLDQRLAAMQWLYDNAGMTLAEIGRAYGITRQAVHQLIDTSMRISVDRKRREIDAKLSKGAYEREARAWRAAESFWSNVEKGPTCWKWRGAKWGPTTHRYGACRGRMAQHYGENYAHRIVYIMFNGPVPEEMNVLHKCDNPWCVNPAHLFLGTQRANTHDSMRKGRFKAFGKEPREETRKRWAELPDVSVSSLVSRGAALPRPPAKGN